MPIIGTAGGATPAGGMAVAQQLAEAAPTTFNTSLAFDTPTGLGNTGGSGGSSFSTAVAIRTGDLVVVSTFTIGNGVYATVSAISDGTNTYTLAAFVNDPNTGSGAFYRQEIWICQNALPVAAGATLSMTLSGATFFTAICAARVAGVIVNNAYDAVAGAQLTTAPGTLSPSITSGSFPRPPEIVFAVNDTNQSGGPTWTPDANWTTIYDNGGTAGGSLVYRIVNSAGAVTYNPTWSGGTINESLMMIAPFFSNQPAMSVGPATLKAAAPTSFQGAGLIASGANLNETANEILAGAGNLAAFLGYPWSGVAVLAGAGSLTAFLGLPWSALVALSGAGSFAAADHLAAAAITILAGSGNLNALSNLKEIALAVLAGNGVLSVSGSQSQGGGVGFAGAGGLAERAALAETASAAFSGSGTMAYAGTLAEVMLVLLAGSGNVAANAQIKSSAGSVFAAFGGLGVLAASVNLAMVAQVAFAGAGGLSSEAYLLQVMAAAFAGAGSLEAMFVPPIVSEVVFRKTLTPLGTKVGSRQMADEL